MKKLGFTLAELLIALAILGVVATFTIPKVLQAQQYGKSKAIAKEAASMVSAAYQSYSLANRPTSATQFDDFRSYLNYVKLDTSGTLIDGDMGFASISCSDASGRICLKLHNGATLLYFTHTFGGTGSTSAIYFMIDPDGTYQGTPESKSMNLYLYYNGRLADDSGILTNTCNSYDCSDPNASIVPPWFSWN